MDIPQELLQAMASMLTSALQASAANITAGNLMNSTETLLLIWTKISTSISMTEYRTSEGSMIQDFKRFDWVLQLSKVTNDTLITHVYTWTEN